MIALTTTLRQQIGKEGEAAYPNECCGILLGRIDGSTRRVEELLPIENAREEAEQYHRFVITPKDFMRGESIASAKGLEITGFYHSHPNAKAEPSQYDQDHALPFYSYVIVAVKNAKAGDLRSWELAEDRSKFFEEEVI
ncbi:MAG: M67 family metallopeptidase [Helicobacteraceae bacterium]|jgi:proteasome lid subunit RPN8/RPN11|nr:M67 family metallopeptidase [Helicobacteraceae bacterium]